LEVEGNKTVTFTATPDNEYKVDKWTIKGGTITGNSGTGDAVYIHGGSCSPKPATDAS